LREGAAAATVGMLLELVTALNKDVARLVAVYFAGTTGMSRDRFRQQRVELVGYWDEKDRHEIDLATAKAAKHPLQKRPVANQNPNATLAPSPPTRSPNVDTSRTHSGQFTTSMEVDAATIDVSSIHRAGNIPRAGNIACDGADVPMRCVDDGKTNRDIATHSSGCGSSDMPINPPLQPQRSSPKRKQPPSDESTSAHAFHDQ
jgi:hypothetical protein